MTAPKEPRSNAASKAGTVAKEALANAMAKPEGATGKAAFRPNKAALKAIEDLMVPGLQRPKLIITGRSTMDGRSATLMRIRPSLWAELEKVETVGTRQYLVVEAALRMFIEHVKAIPDGETLILDGEKMAATEEDHRLLKEAGREVKKYPRKRVAKTNWTDPEENKRALSK